MRVRVPVSEVNHAEREARGWHATTARRRELRERGGGVAALTAALLDQRVSGAEGDGREGWGGAGDS